MDCFGIIRETFRKDLAPIGNFDAYAGAHFFESQFDIGATVENRVRHDFTGQELKNVESLFLFGLANRELNKATRPAGTSRLSFEKHACFDVAPPVRS